MSAPGTDDEASIESTKAPLLEHLIELRRRLLWAVASFVVCFIVCFIFAEQIYAFLTRPLAQVYDGRMISTAITETLFTYIKLGMFGGLCLGFPLIAAQVWMFVAPGLYKKERMAFLPFLIATPIMFTIGAAFVFYVMMPFAIKFLLGYQTQGGAGTLAIELAPRVSEYLDFVMTLIFAFGLTFQLPVLLALLGKVGIVTSRQLRDARRYAIVGMFAVAAFITPPDAISMLSLAIPLTLLYEASIFLVVLFERNRAKEEAARAQVPADAS